MTVGEVRFYVLDVGQGACNYVEIVDDGGTVTHNMLIDLGTNSSQAIAKDNLEWLRQKIVANARYLNVLVITHGDTDHYNMIAKILPAFGPPNNQQIGMVRYGGPDWRYGGGLIATLKTYAKRIDPHDGMSDPDCASFTPSQSSYDLYEDPTWEPIWKSGDEDEDAKLQLIIANVPHPHDPRDMSRKPTQKMNAEAVNTKSVVLGLEWDNYWIVATGDATATTLGAINDLLEHVDSDELPKTFMLTMPHHGSRKTTYDLKTASDIPGPAARGVVDDFLDLFPPRTISISAGEKRHHHPSIYMIEQFAKHISADVTYWGDPSLQNGRHFLTAWIDTNITADSVAPAWPLRPQYATTQTRDNVYCTLYFKSAQYNMSGDRYVCPPMPATALGAGGTILGIPMGRNWIFSMDEDALNVESTDNAMRALAEAPDFAVAPRAPPPSHATEARRRAGTTLSPTPFPPPRRPARIAEPAGPRLRGLRVIA
jgi:hypothetical protein